MLGVLDGVIATKEYLVGGRFTVADLSFVPWNVAVLARILPDLDLDKEFPAVAK